MKTKTFFTALLAIVLLSTAQCEKPDNSKLPPETQEGKNTFGCYVNDELFIAERKYAPFGGYFLSAGYSKELNSIGISAYAKNGSIGFGVLNPKEKTPITLLFANYHVDNLLFEDTDIGEIYLTKFDTVNRIVSGFFSCEIKLKSIIGEANNVDSIVKITEGRFDIKF